MNKSDIVKRIKKYYKKYNNGIELSLVNYEYLNYYIRIDEYKGTYYLRYFDLNSMDKFNKKYINQIIIPEQSINYILDILDNNVYDKTHKDNINDSNELVELKIYTSKHNYNYLFNTFIPVELSYLADIFYVIFSYLPYRFFDIFNELIAKLNNTENKYMYKKSFKFDLFKGKLDNVFSPTIINRGEEYYKNKKVRYLELINNSYYAIVESDRGLYSVIIDYDKKNKNIKLSCNCPCEFFCKHMCAVILAIRNKELFKFYKVRYIEEKSDYYSKLFSLNYFLALDIEDDKIYILYPNGEIHGVYFLDSNKNPMFEVVEDSDDNYLSNKIQELQNKKN